MNVWSVIQQLEGRTLHTLDQNKPFDVVAVTEQTILVQSYASGKERRIKRDEIAPAYEELHTRVVVERADIRERYSNYNSAYVAAILAALPGVRHSVQPIRLRYERSVSR